MLKRASHFNIFCFLDNNGYQNETPAFGCMLALGASRQLTMHHGAGFDSLKKFYDLHPSWLFGHLGFALKGETTGVINKKKAVDHFSDGFFFEPEILIELSGNRLSISTHRDDVIQVFNAIDSEEIEEQDFPKSSVVLNPVMPKEEYLDAIDMLKQLLHRGDCYEINYCHYFVGQNANINPIQTFLKLTQVSPSPFAALYKLDENFCLCASPERYLKKTGDLLLSQPIKGTRKREEDLTADNNAKIELLNNAKERSENVMVVDLVRNDLSKICVEGTVQVEELFGIYSFPQVHQMISSVSGQIPPELHWTDALKATFPMGSMTGAPKKRVLELINEYETNARGLFSGSLGYITPSGDFDFNVVIRSIFYNEQLQEVSVAAGGGITFYSEKEAEYEESLLKVAALRKLLDP